MCNYGNSVVEEISKNYEVPVFNTIVDTDEDKVYLDVHTNKGDIIVILNHDEDGVHLIRVRTINGELKEGDFTLAHTVFIPLDYTRKIEDYRQKYNYAHPGFVAQCVNNLVEEINATEG